MAENTNFDSSKIELRGELYTRKDLELIVDLWNILRRVECIKEGNKRVLALQNWRVLKNYLFET